MTQKLFIRIAVMFFGAIVFGGCASPFNNPHSQNSSTTPAHAPNRDSIALAELRDSLRHATPTPVVTSGGHFACGVLMKMNVLYIGVDNPITINTYGFPPDELVVSITGGTIANSGGPGQFIIRTTSGTQATLNISAKINGVQQNLSTEQYRIKKIPDPVAYVGNVKGDGTMTAAELQNISGVSARMENFDFDVQYQVVSFVMLFNVNGIYIEKKSDSATTTPEMKTMISGLMRGNNVFFEQITVKGPDGTLRKVPGVSIKVK